MWSIIHISYFSKVIQMVTQHLYIKQYSQLHAVLSENKTSKLTVFHYVISDSGSSRYIQSWLKYPRNISNHSLYFSGNRNGVMAGTQVQSPFRRGLETGLETKLPTGRSQVHSANLVHYPGQQGRGLGPWLRSGLRST